MIEREGDVFTTDATYIGHGVNCSGVMGAGIAKTIREKYPQVYLEYKRVCETQRLSPGSVFVYPENGKAIVNLATQNLPGPDARYDWVFLSLYRFSAIASQKRKIEKFGSKIAIPEIGCGIGGLDWLGIKSIIGTVEQIFPRIEYEVWHYQ